MLNHLSNEPSRTNSYTIAQDPYPWKTSINTMQLRLKKMGYTSQVENHWVDQESEMIILIKISKSLTKTYLRIVSTQFHIRWMPLGLPSKIINRTNKYFSHPREISITIVFKYQWAPVTYQSMPTPNAT